MKEIEKNQVLLSGQQSCGQQGKTYVGPFFPPALILVQRDLDGPFINLLNDILGRFAVDGAAN